LVSLASSTKDDMETMIKLDNIPTTTIPIKTSIRVKDFLVISLLYLKN